MCLISLPLSTQRPEVSRKSQRGHSQSLGCNSCNLHATKRLRTSSHLLAAGLRCHILMQTAPLLTALFRSLRHFYVAVLPVECDATVQWVCSANINNVLVIGVFAPDVHEWTGRVPQTVDRFHPLMRMAWKHTSLLLLSSALWWRKDNRKLCLQQQLVATVPLVLQRWLIFTQKDFCTFCMPALMYVSCMSAPVGLMLIFLPSIGSLSPQLEVPGLSSASMMEVGPVGLSFELPKYTCTGLQIRFLRLTPVQPGSSQRWVRYVTHSDSYTIRIWTKRITFIIKAHCHPTLFQLCFDGVSCILRPNKPQLKLDKPGRAKWFIAAFIWTF